MSKKTPDIFERIYARHGHRCPMSTLGGRLGLAAIKVAGEGCENMKLVYSNRTCALDGIAEVTGFSEEDGTLTVKADGRHALLVNTEDAPFEIELSDEALAIAGRYRALCNRLEQGWEHLDADEQGRRRAEMDAMLDEILPQLWQMQDDAIVKTMFNAKAQSRQERQK